MKNRHSWYATRLSTLTVLLGLGSLVGCRPGYLRASDLESSGQGPGACAKSCEDLGMRMGALVLVSNSLPGCVCQPIVAQTPAPAVAAPPAPAVAAPPAPAVAAPPGAPGPAPAPAAVPSTTPTSALPTDATGAQAAAVTTGFVVLAAAAAVHQAEQEHQRRAQAIVY
jgi:hypothetical protein